MQHTHLYVYICIYVFVCTYVYICIYNGIHTHAHTKGEREKEVYLHKKLRHTEVK